MPFVPDTFSFPNEEVEWNMDSTTRLPQRVRVHATGPNVAGLVVYLNFEMNYRNPYGYLLVLDLEGCGVIEKSELLKSFAEQHSLGLMDYVPAESGFTGNISASVMSVAELRGAARAYDFYRRYVEFPPDYKQKLDAAIERGQQPNAYVVEVVADYA